MSELEARLRAAEDLVNPEDYIRRVKDAVIDEVKRADPDAEVRDTGYFNHSAIPDLELLWHRSGKDARDLYLRDSYLTVSASQDVEYLDEEAPIVMTLSSEPAPLGDLELGSSTPPRQLVEQDRMRARETLLTDVAALDAIARPVERESPVSGLVRSNFLRGAYGLIDAPQALSIVDEAATGVMLEAVRSHFAPSAATRIERTAAIMRMALTGRGFQFDDSADVETVRLIEGRLTESEIRGLLPWLLSTEGVTREPLFWSYIGSLMELSDVEGVADDIANMDVSLLVAANADRWEAKRAYLGLSSEEDDDASATPQPMWSFRRRVLGGDLGALRVQLATSGRHFNGRPGGSSPRWAEIVEPLENVSLVSAELQGITRAITVTARQSDDIRADIEQIAESVDDEYFVDNLVVRVAETPLRDEALADISFGRGTVSTHSPVSLTALVELSVGILGHRAQEEPDRLLSRVLDERGDGDMPTF
ncbi:hypothetical protein [Cellulosimicrobium composti]|uniref:hypothetical protein n=1 Tax=Cellulosimicrobium composti TaxID=2672572 RepID=UPI00379E655C